MLKTEEIMKQVLEVPALPAATAEVVNLIQDPDVEFDDLARAIEYDPGLTANVIRLANSVLSASVGQIRSIKEAVVRMGIEEVFQMVMASSIAPLVSNEVMGYKLRRGILWQHSVAVAVGARELAKALGIKAPEYLFTAGLLHDIGKIVLGTFIEIDSTQIIESAFTGGVSFEIAEREVMGVDHAEVGAALLENWKIPGEIVDIVRWHHQPTEGEGDQKVLDMVHLADVMSLSVGLGAGIDGLNYQVSREAAERVGLNNKVIELVISEILDILARMPSLFEQVGKE